MTEYSRRKFLVTGGATAAVGAVAVAAPLASDEIAGASTTPVVHSSDPSAPRADVASGPFIVHVKDASKGELSVLSGSSEFTYRDPALVARIVRSSRRAQG